MVIYNNSKYNFRSTNKETTLPVEEN